MVRIGRSLEVRQVTRDARRTGDVVAAKFRVVAIGTLPRRHRMHPRQCKTGYAVIECGVGPGNRVVAGLAGRGETLVGHGTSRVVEIVLVARDAGGAGQIVVVVAMAVGALARGHGVSSAQRE